MAGMGKGVLTNTGRSRGCVGDEVSVGSVWGVIAVSDSCRGDFPSLVACKLGVCVAVAGDTVSVKWVDGIHALRSRMKITT